MEHSAVLFDLYGTLAPGGTRELRDAVSADVAQDLGVDPARFAEAVRSSFVERSLGRLGSLASTLRTLATQLGGTPSDDQIATACARRVRMTAGLLADTWALDVLDELIDRGYALGLVSDCSIETAMAWPDSALGSRFRTAAFSAAHGVKKPDRRLYEAATDVLRVAPEECVYVGDGGSTELPGAAALGMRAIWLDHPGNQGGASDPRWAGESVADLTRLLDLLQPRHAWVD